MGKAINELDAAGSIVDATLVPVGETNTLKRTTWATIKATLKTYFDTLYQAVLVSGTNIKTINSTSLLGSGDIAVTTSPSGSSGQVQFNNAGAFGASSGLTWDNSAKKLSIVSTDGSGTVLFMQSPYGSSYFGIGGGGTLNWNGARFGAMGGLWAGYDGNPVTWGNSQDVALERDAANELAQRRTTNAQKYRVYGTYTDSSNYRRVAIAMTTAGVASISPEGAGTGASGNVLHISGLPTSNPGPGILWNDTGTVKVGT